MKAIHNIMTLVMLSVGAAAWAQTPPANTTAVKGVGKIPDFWIANSYENATFSPSGINGYSLIDGLNNSVAAGSAVAVTRCTGRGSGWYLPSSMELALAAAHVKAAGTTTWKPGITNPGENYFLSSSMASASIFGGAPVPGYVGYHRVITPHYYLNYGVTSNYYVWCAWRPVNSSARVTSLTVSSYSCANSTATLTATGSGSIEWYGAAEGGTLLATGTTYTTAAIPPTGATYYAQAVSGSDTSNRYPIFIPNVAPAAPTVSFTPPSCGSNVDLRATVSQAFHSVSWYTAASGGSAVASGSNDGNSTYSYTVGTGGATFYYAEARDYLNGCVSATRTLALGPLPPQVTRSATTLGATDGSITLTASALCPTSGVEVDWYDAPTGGTLLATSSTYTATSPFTVYAEARHSATGMVSTTRTEMEISSTRAILEYTGSPQSVTLTPGTYRLEVWGAQGSSRGTTIGGYGGYSVGSYTVSSNTTLYVYVGGYHNGYNGGGHARWGGYGGGGTDIRTTSNSSYSNRIIVAGGGGSAGCPRGGRAGDGGGETGGTPVDQCCCGGQGGVGTATGGGAGGGSSCSSGLSGAGSGGWGTGGIGAQGCNGYGGGGGGGYYGGGGNGADGSSDDDKGGSGGSGYVGGVSGGSMQRGVHTGHGRAIITKL